MALTSDVTTSHSTKLSQDDSKVAGYAHAVRNPRGHNGIPTPVSQREFLILLI